MATTGNELQWALDIAWSIRNAVEMLALRGCVTEQYASDAILASINGVEEFDPEKLG